MHFTKLSAQNFRNLQDVSVSFSPQVNIFLGQNGQGKTNLIEALYVLAQGESFRYGDNTSLIAAGKSQSILRCLIQYSGMEDTIALQIENKTKTLLVNNKKTSWSKLEKKIPIVLFSPESLAAIKESDEQRRQLIDQLLESTISSGSEIIQTFRKALRSRNKLLRSYASGEASESDTKDLLESLNPQYLKAAAELSQVRIQAIKNILPDLQETVRRIMKDQTVDISVEYVISDENALKFTRENIDYSLHQRARQLESAEMAAGTTLVGPHKHDITFLYNQKDSRFFCSQGQQRALILSFKIAQIVYHRRAYKNEPVLMLDDVLSELDFEKRSALISFLKEIKSQVFITTTDVNLPAELTDMEISVRHIEQGQILERPTR